MEGLRFADFTLVHSTRRLTRAGQEIRLGARAFDLLALLVDQHDRVVSRDEIMEAVWPDTVVGDNNLNVQVANLRRILGREAIITVPGRGLHFGLVVEKNAFQPASLPAEPSIVILPFSNLGGDPELDWLTDGVVEDITTEISRFRDLFVVARNSAYQYGQIPRDLRAVSRELGVRYALEGSVRATETRVRVTAQLIEATTGRHVWAEVFDSEMAGHFETQARIAHAVSSCIAPQIERAEATRIQAKTPDDLTAYGLAQRGWAVIARGEMDFDIESRDRSAELAREALARDPDLGLAWRVLAWVAWWHAYHGTTRSLTKTTSEGIEAASNAVVSDPADHHARRLRGLLHLMKQDVQRGLSELQHAHDINPNCALTLCWLGMYEAINGNPSSRVLLTRAGLRRSPRDPALGSMLCAVGFAEFAARNYGPALEMAEAARNETKHGATPMLLETIALVALGRFKRAARIFDELKALAPHFVAVRLSGKWLSSHPDYLDRAHMFLRVAAGQMPADAAEALR